MYINRTIEKKLKYVSEHFPVVMLCGARQVGKTTLLKRLQKIYPIEIKKSADPGKGALKNFSVFNSASCTSAKIGFLRMAADTNPNFSHC